MTDNELETLFKLMFKLPNRAIAAFVNEVDKKIYIFQTSGLIGSLSRNVDNIKSKTHNLQELVKDVSKLKLIILQEYQVHDNLRLELSYWTNYYKSLNYQMYSRNSKNLRLFTKLEVDINNGLILVKLCTQYGDSLVSGVFNKIADANEYRNYLDGLGFIRPIVAINKETRDWYRINGGRS